MAEACAAADSEPAAATSLYAKLRTAAQHAAARGEPSASAELWLRGGLLLDGLPPDSAVRRAHWRTALQEDLVDPQLLAKAKNLSDARLERRAAAA